ncbi:TPA: DUF3987 domain-containing protein [Escherichia coli]|jgi:PHD/YefM family antitoxin component YafN of YafNO toxin-antitoxin module|uniref:DUF3987 domain-containing protein n=1 Tax=Escherichia TaxID=561 RepID=UPI00025C6E38|nr:MULTISPECIES: DUF3987 domain-containing protein [Escherichia]EAA1586463.1 DUF3987 domain-containing protein [Escherichia coli]EAA5675719.1 DUF3987 domain-containing protein [Escherichia coli]EAB9600826.1 DUF3987 domain-containing protein [Escherichia coli]EER8328245.1 DUF3987 domain-containing protein [Escherichia coli]EEY5321612.1 DUF3987 domain-containing protein [Escherichia coli]
MMTTKLSLPELDITKLPDRSQALLNEMHEETGISREILLSVMLTVKAASVQDTHEVELSGGQRTSLQIFMCLSSASGSGKTSACAKLIAPVHETEEELHQAYIDDKKNYDRMMEMWTTDKKILERRYKKEMERSPENAAAARAALEKCIANKPVPPTQQVLIVNDATPEGIALKLSQSPSLLLLSDEGGTILDKRFERKSALYNTLWSGQPVNVERASRPGFRLNDVRLTILILTQPVIFNKFFTLTGDQIRGNGFLARLLFCEPGAIKIMTTEPHTAIPVVTQQCASCFRKKSFGSQIRDSLRASRERRAKSKERICMTLSNAASRALERFHKENMDTVRQNPHMGTFEDIIVRKREQVVRIAALLELEKDPDSTVITLESTNSAIYLIEFYFKHLIYKLESLREISPAEKLDKWLQKRIITTAGYIFQKSYILQYAPYALRKKCVLDEALDILAEQRKIRIDDNLVVYIGNTITPSELAKKLNIPAFDAGVFICDHQNILKYHRNRL